MLTDEEMNAMAKYVVIDKAKDMQIILDACATSGDYRVACVSNAGLTQGRVRVTLFPGIAFTGPTSNADNEWMQAFKHLHEATSGKG